MYRTFLYYPTLENMHDFCPPARFLPRRRLRPCFYTWTLLILVALFKLTLVCVRGACQLIGLILRMQPSMAARRLLQTAELFCTVTLYTQYRIRVPTTLTEQRATPRRPTLDCIFTQRTASKLPLRHSMLLASV